MIQVPGRLRVIQETLETKKDRRDYGLVLGKILTRPCSGTQRKRTKKPLAGRSHERSPLLSSNQDPEDTNKQDNETAKPGPPPSNLSQILTPQSLLLLLGYALLGLQNLSYDAMFPVFLNYPAQGLEDSPETSLPFKFTFGIGMGKRLSALSGHILCG
jgi:hypothetical protein